MVPPPGQPELRRLLGHIAARRAILAGYYGDRPTARAGYTATLGPAYAVLAQTHLARLPQSAGNPCLAALFADGAQVRLWLARGERGTCAASLMRGQP